MPASPTSTEQAPARESLRHIAALDGIRGVAVLLVVASHYGDLSHAHSPVLRMINTIKDAGWAGVDIFFVLSGFLITGILWDAKDQPNRWKNFYMRRALRLFPLYYGVWAALLIYICVTHLPWHNEYLAYVLYFGNIASIYVPAVGIFLTSHFWSLAVEEQFYLLWPFVLWKLGRPRLAMQVLAGAAIFSILLKLVLALAHIKAIWAYQLLPAHMEGLAMGSMLALSWRMPGATRYWSAVGKCWPLVVAVLAALMVYFHGLSNLDSRTLVCAIPVLSLASALLIWNSLIPGSFCRRVMELPILRFYGKYSYGLYIYHFLLRRVLRDAIYSPLVARIHNPVIAGSIYLIICMVLLTALAMASFHLFENYFLRMKRHF